MDKVHSLSEAMRYGASLRPQCFEMTYQRNGTEIHSCAIGAAAEGIGYDPEQEGIIGTHLCWAKLVGRFPEINKKAKRTCPVCHAGYSSLSDVIYHINDKHYWTREAVADWLKKKGL